MILLGISHPISWNNAACLLVDGQLVAMVEEERLNRQKHAPHNAPVMGIQYCLEASGLTIDDVDCIAVGFGRPWNVVWGHIQQANIRSVWQQALRWMIETFRYERTIPWHGQKPLLFVNHHLSHAASTYYVSGFEDAMILSIDGSGGSESGILAYGRGDTIKVLERISNEGSWGLLYEEITELLGFRRHSGEGKTMGLAPFGAEQNRKFDFIHWSTPIPWIDPIAKQRYLATITPRRRNEPLSDIHKQLAATVQNSLEQAMVQMVYELHRRTGSRNLCLAGGCALNCSMNGVLRELDIVDNIFIQPAAHDAGTALGAALIATHKLTGKRPTWIMNHVYWGPEYGNEEILKALRAAGITNYCYSNDICKDTADLLVAGKLVGWFQGRIEIGPRALGNRSILAHPGDPTAKDRVNIQVKRREPWRPFAPSIQEEYVSEYLFNAQASPFMLQAFITRPERVQDLCSAIHVDNSCRPQTVSRITNPRYWQLIEEFRQRTNIAAVLNTSFNIDSQPIVCHPTEAVWTFQNSGLDAMSIGDYLVWK